MIRTTLAACGVWAIIASPLSAQAPTQTLPAPTPTPQTRPSTTTQPARTDAPQIMILTGCVKPWEANMATAGSAASEVRLTGAGVAQQYALTNAQPAMSAAVGTSAPGMPTPPANGPPAMAAHTSYLLKAQTSSINLAVHVNHKVEVTGALATTSPANGLATATAGTEAEQVFTITALKVIDKICS